MLKYAANDVIFLPKIYYLMLDILKGMKKLTITDIFNSCESYLLYPTLNNNITINSRESQESNQVQGLIK